MNTLATLLGVAAILAVEVMLLRRIERRQQVAQRQTMAERWTLALAQAEQDMLREHAQDVAQRLQALRAAAERYAQARESVWDGAEALRDAALYLALAVREWERRGVETMLVQGRENYALAAAGIEYGHAACGSDEARVECAWQGLVAVASRIGQTI